MTIQDQTAKRILRILCVLAVAIASGAQAAAAQSPAPKTVADFFLLVPEKYFSYDLRFREELLRGQYRSATVDIRNGYISWDASDAPDSFEFAIFRKTDGSYVVAYNDTGDDFDQPEDDLILLAYERGTWRDVTRALLPATVDGTLVYKLPRQGKDIEVTDQGGRRLYTLTWANDRFRMKRTAGRKID